MTLNALRTACNQTSSRDPVMDLDEPTVEATARALREAGLVRVVWSDTGRRTRKYHQTLDEAVPLEDTERALVTVLLLRGAQSAGELRARTERLHPFAAREDVEARLQAMAARTPPLVERLEQRSGRQDHRWVHRLGPTAEDDAGPAGEGEPVDREVPLAGGAAARDERVRRTYATVAADYAATLGDELAELPFERWLLDRVSGLAGTGPSVEVGCGPGHVTAHLAAAGADVRGLDLSPEMVEQARARYPALRFEAGDLHRLLRPEAAEGWSAVLAWYSLTHLAGSELAPAVQALARPLARGGVLVLALHAGREVRRVTEWLGHPVEVDVVLHEVDDVGAALVAAGLVDLEWYQRGPVLSRGETTERLYVLARRPG